MKHHYTRGVDIKYLPEPFNNYSITDEGVLLKETKPNQLKVIATLKPTVKAQAELIDKAHKREVK